MSEEKLTNEEKCEIAMARARDKLDNKKNKHKENEIFEPRLSELQNPDPIHDKILTKMYSKLKRKIPGD